jgi:hypothetical protein
MDDENRRDQRPNNCAPHDTVLTYLKLTGLRKGLIINFNVSLLKDGLRSIVR